MLKILLFGGSGGIGVPLTEILSKGYEVTQLSSKDCNIEFYGNLAKYHNFDYVINLSCLNMDSVIHKSNEDDMLRQLSVNCAGAVNIIKHFTAQWREWQHFGKIIMMSSFLSARPVRGAGIYSATKAFTDNLVRTAAIENAKYGIQINSIQAGYFDAGLTDKLPKDFKEIVRNKIPVGRFGKIEELASAVKFLLENDYVTGSNLIIDGGISLV